MPTGARELDPAPQAVAARREESSSTPERTPWSGIIHVVQGIELYKAQVHPSLGNFAFGGKARSTRHLRLAAAFSGAGRTNAHDRGLNRQCWIVQRAKNDVRHSEKPTNRSRFLACGGSDRSPGTRPKRGVKVRGEATGFFQSQVRRRERASGSAAGGGRHRAQQGGEGDGPQPGVEGGEESQ